MNQCRTKQDLMAAHPISCTSFWRRFCLGASTSRALEAHEKTVRPRQLWYAADAVPGFKFSPTKD